MQNLFPQRSEPELCLLIQNFPARLQKYFKNIFQFEESVTMATFYWITIFIFSIVKPESIDKIQEKKLYYDYSFLSLYMAEKTYKRITPPGGFRGYGSSRYPYYNPLSEPSPLTANLHNGGYFGGYQLTQECGNRKARMSRIIGGSNIRPGEFPWLGFTLKGNEVHCGCSLLSPRWSISAAHCFEKQLLQMYEEIQRIFYGRSSLTGQEASGQAVFVSEVISHENFDVAFRNDIALLRHQNSLELTDYIQPICLNSYDRNVHDKNAVIAGFGLTENGQRSYSAQKAHLKIVSREKCNVPEIMNGAVLDKMICAGDVDGYVDACRGDSGGPLVVEEGGVYFLYGIVSWGIGCGMAGKLGVYTNVIEFIDWIQNTIQD